MKALVLIEKKELNDSVSFAIEAHFGLIAVRCLTISDALEQILDLSDFSFVICEDKDVNSKLIKFLATQETKLPTVLVRDVSVPRVLVFPDLVVGSIPWENSLDVLKDIITTQVKKGRIKLNLENLGEYCRIRPILITRIGMLKADVYIRLSENKFVKLFNQGTEIEIQDLEGYLKKKNIDFLFVKRGDAGEFLAKLNQDIINLINTVPGEPAKERQVAQYAIESLHDISDWIGSSPEAQELAKQSVKLTIKSMGNSPRLKGVLGLLTKEKGQYISTHSIGLAEVSCALATAMSWASETTYQKLTYASLFHDIAIKNQELAKIQDLDSLEKNKDRFTEAETALFKNHPNTSSELIGRLNEIPSDVGTVVAQHHERANGKGFPRGLVANQISPLSCVFIVAHDLVHFLLETQNVTVEDFIRLRKDVYVSGNFKKIYETLLNPKKSVAA